VIPLDLAEPGFDVVIFERLPSSVRKKRRNRLASTKYYPPGHVGFYAGIEANDVLVLGGNQGDSVSIAPYLKSRLLGVRRLA
jgi:hypothetical protein